MTVLAGPADDAAHLVGTEGPHRVRADAAEGPYLEQGRRRGFVVGELGHGDDVVLADRIERFTDPAALALGELGEILPGALSCPCSS